jgi:hypothetical protein
MTRGTTLEEILVGVFPEGRCFLDSRGFGPLKYDHESEMMRNALPVALHGSSPKVSPQQWAYDDLRQVMPDLNE